MMYDLEKLHNDIILKYNEVFFKTNNFLLTMIVIFDGLSNFAF